MPRPCSEVPERSVDPIELPLPPIELRRLIGPTEAAAYENPSCQPIFPHVDPRAYETVFDFGCGCGRLARQLIQQEPRPERYVGVDVHRGMVAWCRENLQPRAPEFEFHHHDVFSIGFNRRAASPSLRALPSPDGAFRLVIAWSIFTHLVEPQAEFYLREIARILDQEGFFVSTWFLFDKMYFPMMQEFQNALYINTEDPTNAVIFDRSWLRSRARDAGLTVTHVIPPELRGFQWLIVMRSSTADPGEAEFPPDTAEFGLRRPPLLPPGADRLGSA